MNINLTLGPLISLIAGILILIVPRLLNYIVAIYLIVIGAIGLFGTGNHPGVAYLAETLLAPTSRTVVFDAGVASHGGVRFKLRVRRHGNRQILRRSSVARRSPALPPTPIAQSTALLRESANLRLRASLRATEVKLRATFSRVPRRCAARRQRHWTRSYTTFTLMLGSPSIWPSITSPRTTGPTLAGVPE